MGTVLVTLGCAYVYTYVAVTVLWFGAWRPCLRATRTR